MLIFKILIRPLCIKILDLSNLFVAKVGLIADNVMNRIGKKKANTKSAFYNFY